MLLTTNDIIQAEIIYKDKVKAFNEDSFKAVYKEFFERNPTVKAVFCSGRTPSFNDGDPCTFHMNDFFYTSNDEAIRSVLEDGNNPEETDGWDYMSHANGSLYEDLKSISNIPEDCWERTFTENFEITATPEKLHHSERDYY
jgi:hypothetical protein